MKCGLGVSFALACVALTVAGARAEWRPPDLRPAQAPLARVLARTGANREGAQSGGQRHERWTYRSGAHRLAVEVTVRGEDFRAAVALGRGIYAAGRTAGVRLRADANGIAHATFSDQQGDPVDRLPQSIFPFALADCAVAGTSDRFGPAWIVVNRPPHDKPHWLYVDRRSGAVTREMTREGARTIVTTFDRFEQAGTTRRPRHWNVRDGDAGHELDVTVDAVERRVVLAAELASPARRRVFAPAQPAARGVFPLTARFRNRTIFVEVGLAGRKTEFVLDTGTAGIVLDRDLAERRGWRPVLDHVTVPRMTVGALALSDVSTLTLPLDSGWRRLGGILGSDFFRGHVVHIDYAGRRVEVLRGEAARAAFGDARNAVASATFGEGVPLVRAAFGPASGARFVLDTGSPHLYALAPFARRFEREIAAHWTASSFADGTAFAEPRYLEGSIAVSARRAPAFTLGPRRFDEVTVGLEERNARPDAMDVPLDGIIGTDHMSAFEWWFDYDGGRIALRRNGLS